MVGREGNIVSRCCVVAASCGRRLQNSTGSSGIRFGSGRHLREPHCVIEQGGPLRESGGAPIKRDQNRDKGAWPEIYPGNPLFIIPSFPAGSDGPTHRSSAFQEKQTDPLVTGAGCPNKHIEVSPNLKFPLDERAHLPSDLAEAIKFYPARGPSVLVARNPSART